MESLLGRLQLLQKWNEDREIPSDVERQVIKECIETVQDEIELQKTRILSVREPEVTQ